MKLVALFAIIWFSEGILCRKDYCSLLIVIDETFYNKYDRDETQVKQLSLDLVKNLNEIYEE